MIGIFAVFLAISAVIGIRDKKRLDARERRRLRENFGKPGAKENRLKLQMSNRVLLEKALYLSLLSS